MILSIINRSKNNIIIMTQTNTITLYPFKSYDLSIIDDLKLTIAHSYTSNYHKVNIEHVKRYVADIVLDTQLTIKAISNSENGYIDIHDIREGVVDPLNLFYNSFVLNCSNSIYIESFRYLVSNREKIFEDMKSERKKDNRKRIIGVVIADLCMCSFFFLGILLTNFKLFFASIIAIIILISILFEVVSIIKETHQPLSAPLLINCMNESFIYNYFSQNPHNSYVMWKDEDFSQNMYY